MCALCADLPLICPPLDWTHLHKHKRAQTDTCTLDIWLICCKAASLPVLRSAWLFNMCVHVSLCVQKEGTSFILIVITPDLRHFSMTMQRAFTYCHWDHQSAPCVSLACLQTVCRCCFGALHKKGTRDKKGRGKWRGGGVRRRRRTCERQISKDWDRRRESPLLRINSPFASQIMLFPIRLHW